MVHKPANKNVFYKKSISYLRKFSYLINGVFSCIHSRLCGFNYYYIYFITNYNTSVMYVFEITKENYNNFERKKLF